MLDALGVTFIEKPGYEGDDVIGTLASMGDEAGYRTLVLSGDRDAFQLINNNITVLYPGHHFKDLKHMTPDAVVEKYHVTPEQYPSRSSCRCLFQVFEMMPRRDRRQKRRGTAGQHRPG